MMELLIWDILGYNYYSKKIFIWIENKKEEKLV